ncbi:tRNA (guanosine(37)-N1)-methyltransferase TrmD [Cellulomonas carbonis]|uniref:tRNA (guanine-N(1)-)-methyltransferase n=1 Tax=Cellulomonas carbonis T26 TaxID=947969 RepID=A0A0A0BRX7_9CELL|nr:tRNA (guanosine(37)-N1)-methyltransferase TrmD [Cellulomonas carbonis]KGM09889.1 tRNA (guanine-N1)-methyltransferase [Cellulomonas carbonis T26]GGB97950.1 tRNA (guanine-N(1)-)-methyltransferase [Cellulomonas carbonis]
MRIDVLTIFPEYLAPLDLSLVGKARTAGLLDLRVHDLRRWATDRHRTVDDTPLGGGAGMVMRPDVWGEALDEVLGLGDGGEPGRGPDHEPDHEPSGVELLVPTPSGERFTQRTAERLAGVPRLAFACGRYEGIDARVAEHYRGRGVRVTELSLGDYVLNGGEVAALVVVEAVARLLPGVVGNPESLVEESHGVAGLLEYPVYTRPPVWRGHEAPEVLLSGHHARIARWRRDRALERTVQRRPDLAAALDPATLDRHDREILAGCAWEVGPDGPHPAGAGSDERDAGGSGALTPE